MRLTFTIPLADDGSLRAERRRKPNPKKRSKRPKAKAKKKRVHK